MTKSFIWKEQTRQASFRWHPDRRPEIDEVFPPIPKQQPKRLLRSCPTETCKIKDRGKHFLQYRPHVETIPEDFMFTLDDFEEGRVPNYDTDETDPRDDLVWKDEMDPEGVDDEL
jgi:hypothetical protein